MNLDEAIMIFVLVFVISVLLFLLSLEVYFCKEVHLFKRFFHDYLHYHIIDKDQAGLQSVCPNIVICHCKICGKKLKHINYLFNN